MATKKFTELQGYSDADLLNELKESEQQFQKLQFDHAVKGLDNPLTIRELRRDIARLKTEVRRRELSAMPDEVLSKRNKLRARRRLNK
jgi:large subunit ribosomal protein L29